MRVGITGGIGAGKSTVARMFAILGVPVYDADSQAREISQQDPDLQQQIIQHFGQAAYSDGKLNRPFLASQVFGNPDQLAILNSLIHPAVARHFEQWAYSQNAPYVLKEAALLFETGSYQSLDYNIMVCADQSLRTSRVMKRDPQRTPDEIQNIMARQWPEEEKIKLADFLVENNEQKLIIPQVLHLHQLFLEKASW